MKSVLDIIPKPEKGCGIAWSSRIVIVRNILDNLPKEVWNSETKFIDPICKSGIFLEEILNRLMMIDYWKEKYEDIYKRRLAIINKQLFAITDSEIAKTITERVLYCKIVGSENIKYIKNYNEIIDNNKLNDTIKKEFKGIKFNVIIGDWICNTKCKIDAVEILSSRCVGQLVKLDIDYLSMITSVKWYYTNRGTINKFKKDLIESGHLTEMHHIEKISPIYGDIVNSSIVYFLYNRKRVENLVKVNNYEYTDNKLISISSKIRDIKRYKHKYGGKKLTYLIIGDNMAESIVGKTLERSSTSILDKMNVYNNKSEFMRRSLLDKHRVIMNKTLPNYKAEKVSSQYSVISVPKLVDKNDDISSNCIIIDDLNNEEAIKLTKYMKTKFVRFLIKATTYSKNLSNNNFVFVPYLDFSKDWTDDKLYKMFGLTKNEIKYIEDKIVYME